MSVSFWIVGAPTQRVQPYPKDEPDLWTDEPVPPFTELNLANGNAAAMLDALGVTGDMFGGEWDAAELRRIQACIASLQASRAVRATLTEPTIIDGNNIHCGRTLDYVDRRLDDFKKLVDVALQHNMTVTYG